MLSFPAEGHSPAGGKKVSVPVQVSEQAVSEQYSLVSVLRSDGPVPDHG